MIQGGGFEPGMTPRKTREPIQNEADNGLSNKTGTIAMARTMDPHPQLPSSSSTCGQRLGPHCQECRRLGLLRVRQGC